MDSTLTYPRSADTETVYIKNVVDGQYVSAGDFSMYNDVANDPRDFQKNCVLYQYPINNDHLVIGKYCSIARGAKFIFNSANHAMAPLSTYPFPLFFEEWGMDWTTITDSWDNKGDIVVGNDVWIGFEALIMAGVTIGDGAIIGARAVVTKDVEPYTIVAGVPARPIRRRFDDATVEKLLRVKWWDFAPEKVKEKLAAIKSGDVDALL